MTKKEFTATRIPAINPFLGLRYDPSAFLLQVHVVPSLGFIKDLKKYDIIHFHDDVDLSLSFFSSFIQKPKVFQCHTICSSHKSIRTRIFQEDSKNAGDSYVCVSGYSKNLLTDVGIPKTSISVIHNGVNASIFKPISKKSDNILLFVGRPEKRKGRHILLESLMHITTPSYLKIIGPIDEFEYQNLKLIVGKKEKMGIHEIQLVGRVDRDKLLEAYQTATMFVCPSTSDDFAIVNIEALACGTPVIASSVGGIQEVVRHNVDGLLVPPNEPRSLALAIQKLLDNSDLREQLGQNGKKLVEARFSWDAVADQFIDLYKKTIAN